MDGFWRIELFGGLRLVSDRNSVIGVRRQRTAALLAYLAFYADRRHPREILADLFWPEMEPEAAHHNLRQALTSLRHLLEPPDIPAGSILLADRSSACLNPVAATTDVADFTRALADAKGEEDPMPALFRAVDLYQGELLPGYYESWVIREQARLRERFLEAAHRLIVRLEGDNRLERALEIARHATGADPFVHEEAHRDLIRLLGRSNRREDALRQYSVLERLMREKLSAEPSTETRRALESIARSDDPKPPVASDTPPDASRAPAPVRLPAGIVVILLLEIQHEVGVQPQVDQPLLSAFRREFRRFNGREIRRAGAMAVAFPRPKDGLTAAVAAQRACRDGAEDLPGASGHRLRMALHVGEVPPEKDGYPGRLLDRVGGLLSAAHPGQILCSEEMAALLHRDPAPRIELSDLGVFQLRPSERPERLYQVNYPGMAEPSFPPPNAERPHTGYLPATLTAFFGREEEMARLMHLLASRGTRLVTMTGPGGAGKTRLSVETARRLVEVFHGAVCFVPLASLSDPGLIPRAILGALDLAPEANRDPLEQAMDVLNQGLALLVLDNFEQLTPGGAVVVQALLERVPSLTCLVTSRHKLNVAGEREFPVPPLPIPRGGEHPEELTRNPSVQLFLDRAQAVRADFQVTERNAASISLLCSTLEGIPLALELAAARAPVVTVGRMLEQLETRFEALVSQRKGIAPRHATLRAAIDWSFNLLSSDLQRAFARLSVFRDGWTAEAAEAVCGETRPLDTLTQLMNCSLVLREEAPSGMRFGMLETLREYAGEHLTEAERRELPKRHAAYLTRIAEGAEAGLTGTEQPATLESLEAEHDNLRAALAWSLENDPDTALRLAGALPLFWEMHGHVREGRRWLEASLRGRSDVFPGNGMEEGVRASAGDALMRARALYGAGRLASIDADLAVAQGCLAESLALYRGMEAEKGAAGCLVGLALTTMLLADFPASLAYGEDALVLSRKIGDTWAEKEALQALGDTSLCMALPDAAIRYHQQGMALAEAVGDRRGSARALQNIGLALWLKGDLEAARERMLESLEAFRALEERFHMGRSFWALGRIACLLGRFDEARVAYRECARYCPRAASWTEPYILEGCAYLAMAEGYPERCAQLLGAADAARANRNTPRVPAESVEYDQTAGQCLSALGEAVFRAAMAEGLSMPVEQALEYALEGTESPALLPNPIALP